jgi:hypothetical protein
MAFIKGETLEAVCDHLMEQTMDGNFPLGLSPDVVYSVVKARLQADDLPPLIAERRFSFWLQRHQENIKGWNNNG